MLKKITKWETEDGKVFDTQEEAEDYMFEQEKEVMTHTSTEQPEALRLARDLMESFSGPTAAESAAELRRLHARVQELEQASRRAPAVPVPQSIEQMAVDRYKVVPSHESMFHRWAVVAGDGQQQLYIGREVECLNMARKFAGAFLDGAFVAMQNTAPAHPADGVPAPVAVPDSAAHPNPDEIRAIARSVSTGASDSPSPSEYVMAGYRAALAATPASACEGGIS